MQSLSFAPSLLPPLPALRFSPSLSLQHRQFSSDQNHYACYLNSNFLPFSTRLTSSFHARQSVKIRANEGAEVEPLIDFEDFHEKDWSFLESMELNSKEHNQKIEHIIKAGDITETSRVLVSVSSEGFVDRLVESSPCGLVLVVHDSLFVLASIKEKYDNVKCWQGELIYVPEKWSPLDVVFLCFLPALPFKLDQVFETLAKRCLPGARLVISHPQGREAVEQQREQFPDIVVSDLPDKINLQNIAKKHCFEMAEFVDEPGFYLAVLKHAKDRNTT